MTLHVMAWTGMEDTRPSASVVTASDSASRALRTRLRFPRLAHYLVEKALKIEHGFWGPTARGAVLPTMRYIDGRCKTEGR